jgi:GNAT superfamily N-acetyltransferase
MERESISQVFNNWERFGAIGGAMFVDGKMVAFTYGVPINGNTFDLCVEKGDIAYKGVYTVVRHEFMQQIPEQYTYINLEEDLGLPGLRRAKSSYHPAYQIQKDRAISYPELSATREQFRREGVRLLMQTVFNDSDKALDIFFSHMYTPSGNYCRVEDGQVVSAAQALPYSVNYHGQHTDAVYLYAVGTLPQYRGQGMISRLFKYMHRGLLCQGKILSTLLIEQPGLQEMYEKLGYAQVGTAPLQDENVVENGFEAYDRWQHSRPCVLLHDERTWAALQVYSRFDKSYYLVKPHYRGMVRVVNALEALRLYAAVHPDRSLTLRVTGDEHISESNGCYAIEGGAVQRVARCTSIKTVLTINQLAEFLFDEFPLEMPLVLL